MVMQAEGVVFLGGAVGILLAVFLSGGNKRILRDHQGSSGGFTVCLVLPETFFSVPALQEPTEYLPVTAFKMIAGRRCVALLAWTSTALPTAHACAYML
eukprot:110897-Pelagomonas_calceolata.AAC.5